MKPCTESDAKKGVSNLRETQRVTFLTLGGKTEVHQETKGRTTTSSIGLEQATGETVRERVSHYVLWQEPRSYNTVHNKKIIIRKYYYFYYYYHYYNVVKEIEFFKPVFPGSMVCAYN